VLVEELTPTMEDFLEEVILTNTEVVEEDIPEYFILQ
jgi:hypothetical protein